MKTTPNLTRYPFPVVQFCPFCTRTAATTTSKVRDRGRTCDECQAELDARRPTAT
jgi:hypothetical protein